MKLLRRWLLFVVALVLVLAALLGGPLGLWGEDSTSGRSTASVVGPTPDGPDQKDDASHVDRMLGRCTAVEEALDRGQLALALNLIQAGEQGGVPVTVRKRWTAARKRADAGLDKAVNEAARGIATGQILAARSRLLGLTDPPSPLVTQRLDELCTWRRWPPWPGRRARGARPDAEVAVATTGNSLARHRRVRVVHRSGVVTASVWQAKPGNVTVRLQDQGGAIYPVFDRAAVEPVDPTFQEACEQVRICHAAGEGLLAWLWLCYCTDRPEASSQGAELTALADLLRQ